MQSDHQAQRAKAGLARLSIRTALLSGTGLGMLAMAQPVFAQTTPTTCTRPPLGTANLASPTSPVVVISAPADGADGADRSSTINGAFGRTAGAVNASGTHIFTGSGIRPTVVVSLGSDGGDGQDTVVGAAGNGGNGGNGNRIFYQACGLDELIPNRVGNSVVTPQACLLYTSDAADD